MNWRNAAGNEILKNYDFWRNCKSGKSNQRKKLWNPDLHEICSWRCSTHWWHSRFDLINDWFDFEELQILKKSKGCIFSRGCNCWKCEVQRLWAIENRVSHMKMRKKCSAGKKIIEKYWFLALNIEFCQRADMGLKLIIFHIIMPRVLKSNI